MAGGHLNWGRRKGGLVYSGEGRKSGMCKDKNVEQKQSSEESVVPAAPQRPHDSPLVKSGSWWTDAALGDFCRWWPQQHQQLCPASVSWQ